MAFVPTWPSVCESARGPPQRGRAAGSTLQPAERDIQYTRIIYGCPKVSFLVDWVERDPMFRHLRGGRHERKEQREEKRT